MQGCLEPVTVTFDETHKATTQNGPNFVRIADTVHDQGTGIGQFSGAQYQFSSMGQNTFRSSVPNFSVRVLQREHLIRQGQSVPGDDLYVVETFMMKATNGHPVFTIQDVQKDTCK